MDINRMEEQIGKYQPDNNRKARLKAWFHKYAGAYDTLLYSHHGRFQSAFAIFMKEKMGVELLFHASGDKQPYGYTVIDHSGKQVFKGGEIIALKELLAIPQTKSGIDEEQTFSVKMTDETETISQEKRDYYAAILKAALHNYPDLVQGLQHQGLMVIRNGETFTLHDPVDGIFIDTNDLLNEKDHQLVVEHFSQAGELNEEVYRQHHYFHGINLASDIDDEAIHGRNRSRKRKGSTNCR